MTALYDIAVVGSGFGGSLLSMIARQSGRSVILIERGRHPRFAIGESSTPLANLLLEQLAERYGLSRLLPLTRWGRWRENYPGLACGLKRGFTFYHHTPGQPWTPSPDHDNELLVAASPHDRIADTHWYRADFDQFLVQEAERAGVEYWDQTELRQPRLGEDTVEIPGTRLGRPFTIRARFLVDASGPRGFLHRAWGIGETPVESMPPTGGLYTHFTGVRRWGDLPGRFRANETPPYPVDDAAMHHVFEGGWIWVLRFNNGVTSAGVAATAATAHELRLAEGAPAWARLLDRLPSVREQFAEAQPVFPFVHAPRLSFRSTVAAGPRWALLPSAAGFIDPLLSNGFPLTLLGISRLGATIERHWGGEEFGRALAAYNSATLSELDLVADLVGALYARLGDFPLFTALSLLYFAAASFTESARRLGQPGLAGDTFLAGDHATFGPGLRRCCAQARRRLAAGEKAELLKEIYETMEPLDVAGLTDRSRRNWYGVQAGDLIAAAGKLGVDAGAIHRLLERCEFAETTA